MGQGIAEVALVSGCDVTLCDSAPAALARAHERIAASLARSVAKQRLSDSERTHALTRLHANQNLADAVARAELVIEAAPEVLSLKRALFAAIAAAAPPSALLATNTSSLSVSEIAAAATAPERVVGLHFFNPPQVNKLLEIVRGQATSDETVARARHWGERLGRDIIVVKDSPGFASSRLGVVLALEAIRMLEAGVASAEDIDRAMESGYRHHLGPLRTTDLVGLDVRLAIAESLHARLGGAHYEPPALLRAMVRDGKLGKKSGEGFYRWDRA
jgi:3-hydroxybutyryl-CoA dehydrogenase